MKKERPSFYHQGISYFAYFTGNFAKLLTSSYSGAFDSRMTATGEVLFTGSQQSRGFATAKGFFVL